MRALHKLLRACRAHHRTGGGGLGEKACASKRRRRWRRERTRIDGSELIIAECSAGDKQAVGPHAEATVEQRTLAVVVKPA